MLGFAEMGVGGHFLFLVGLLPDLGEALWGDKLAVFYSAVDVVEWAVTVFDFFVQFAELPGELLAVIPGDVQFADVVEVVAELLEDGLELAGVELEWAFHDAAVVEVGNVDDMSIFGAGGAGFFVFDEIGEEGDNWSHLSLSFFKIIISSKSELRF